MQPRTARVVLRMVGVAAILFAAFGFWYNVGTFRAYSSGALGSLPTGQPIAHFGVAFLALSVVCVGCFVALAFCGVHLFRLSVSWLWLLIAVASVEVLSVLAVGGLWLLPEYGVSIVAATGVSMGGLTPQLLLLFPLWGPLLVWFARKSLLNG